MRGWGEAFCPGSPRPITLKGLAVFEPSRVFPGAFFDGRPGAVRRLAEAPSSSLRAQHRSEISDVQGCCVRTEEEAASRSAYRAARSGPSREARERAQRKKYVRS